MVPSILGDDMAQGQTFGVSALVRGQASAQPIARLHSASVMAGTCQQQSRALHLGQGAIDIGRPMVARFQTNPGRRRENRLIPV